MISKKTVKYIKSLQIKKYRNQEQCFLVEGAKSVVELFNSDFNIRTILGTPVFLKRQKQFFNEKRIEVIEAAEPELSAVGTFKTNNAALAVVEMKANVPIEIKGTFSIGLDRVNDPGNIGTIIRIADWYGIKNIICSSDCADRYNPKVIAASMGSFTRVNMYYADLKAYLKDCAVPVLGAFLNGENVHKFNFPQEGILVMGSESQGIEPDLEKFITKKINIPAYGEAESLNVAVATAIICDNMKRNIHPIKNSCL